MSVSKAIDLMGTGDTIEDAISEAIDRATGTLQAVTAFEVGTISGVLVDGRFKFEVRMHVWFTLLERMHG
ncbi:dodecin family protein [Mycolicibacterium gadium]|uniref:Dodecin family protein n=1 Tax=Mycolicibacterium gadium TaxID=1794 RepID=A0ABT6GZX7_MYCGU|nr:dodecin family protein [Mycolicibacterium gadium]MDG5486978.1 dodecin family protein [Mycolicibacterium gadium]